MQDTELYGYLLGLKSPWTVERVNVDVTGERVDVWTTHAEGLRWPCPECGIAMPLYDHAPERTWRHLDSCQFMTFLHARPPRINCSRHGVLQVKLPWADEKARFTALFERLAIEALGISDILGATTLLRLSWDEGWNIMDRAVRRGLARKGNRVPGRMGVDEKSVGRGHTYVTVVTDLDRSTVEYLGDDRRKESLDVYFERFTAEEKAGIKAIAMDIWDPYLASIRDHIPEAEEKIVFDRYHLMTHMVKAVDEVRKAEHRNLQQAGDETLTGTKYLWLYSKERVPDRRREELWQLSRRNLKTARAWAIKESFRELWGYTRLAWAARHFRAWFFWATHSRLEPVIEVARMFRKYLTKILSYFWHRITNAVSEGLNSKIQTIKKKAYGYRNREHFKIAVYFHCGGLDLSPVTH
jgi:transposase